MQGRDTRIPFNRPESDEDITISEFADLVSYELLHSNFGEV
jgi:hypothetical protein